MKEFAGKLNAEGMKVGIVVSRFNDFLTKELLGGAVDCLVRHGASADDLCVAWTPGANETPLVAEKLAATGTLDAVVVVGAVVQGATPHAELINTQISRSLARLASASGMPVINGVVCASTLEQAIERCGTKAGNKGWQAALAAIEMVSLYRTISA